MKLIRWLTLLVGVLITTAFMATAQAPLKPESFWPSSWVAWLTAILVLADVLARAFGLYKWSQKGVMEKLDRMEKHFDDELKDIREDMDLRMNGFTVSTEGKMNGFGGRVEQVEDDITGINATLTAIQVDLSASKTDRVNINRTLDEIKRGQDKILDFLIRRP